jgi:hypothetical protein
MNQSAIKTLCILGLIFPLIFFAWQMHDNINKDDTYQSWRIKIIGYDPRHILKGRFIRYSYEFDWNDGSDKQTCEAFKDDCCLCLNGEYEAPKAELLSCSSITDSYCTGILKGKWKNEWRGFDFGLREYYTDERAAKTLDKILRAGEVEMHVDLKLRPMENGSPVLTKKARLGELYIDGKPLSQMLADGDLPLER